MNLSADYTTNHLKASCLNAFCNAVYTLPQFEVDFCSDYPDVPKSPLGTDMADGCNDIPSPEISGDIQSTETVAEGGEREERAGEEDATGVEG